MGGSADGALGDAGTALSPSGPGSHLPPGAAGTADRAAERPLSAPGAGLWQLHTTVNEGPSPDIGIRSAAGGLPGRRAARVLSPSLRWKRPPIAAGSARLEAGAGRPRALGLLPGCHALNRLPPNSHMGALTPHSSGVTVFRDGRSLKVKIKLRQATRRALMQHDCVLFRMRDLETHRERRGDGGRAGRDVSPSRGPARVPSSRSQRGAWHGLSLEAARRTRPATP